MRQRSPSYTIAPRPFRVLLPIMPRVVFVDWNGVLCNDVFWSSIQQNQMHPYHKSLTQACYWLFGQRRDLVDMWMRGTLDTDHVIRLLNVKLDRRCGKDYLLRRLREDCKRMKGHSGLIEELRQTRQHAFVVLATDNVDCFFEQVDVSTELRSTVDAVLCSTALGALKSDNVTSFFKPWLDQHQLTFSQALLLDDSELICARFRSAGGVAIQVESVTNAIEALRSWRIASEEASRTSN